MNLTKNNVPQGRSNGGGVPLNIARYKKSLSSILSVQLALAACYGPLVILALLFVIGIEKDLAWTIVTTLVHFNSSLNPIPYCWKIREVRRAAKATIMQLNCV